MRQSVTMTVTGKQINHSIYVKQSTYQYAGFISLGIGDSTIFKFTVFDLATGLQTGAIGNSGTGGPFAITSVGSGWYRVDFTSNGAATAATGIQFVIGLFPDIGVQLQTIPVNTGILVWHPSLSYGTAPLRYQSQSASGTYTSTGFPQYINYAAATKNLVSTWGSSLGSACTIAYAVPGVGTTILTGQTIGTTYTDTTDHAGKLIINRALTAGETALVTQYLNAKANAQSFAALFCAQPVASGTNTLTFRNLNVNAALQKGWSIVY